MKTLLIIVSVLFISLQVLAIPLDASKKKQQELKSLRTEINRLKVEINKTEANKSQAMGALQQSEMAISEANSILSELQKSQALSQSQLKKMQADMVQIKANLMTSQVKITDLLRTRYQTGQDEAWRLMLNQQSPNAVMRDLQYYTYIVKAQQKLVNELKSQLLTLDRLAEEIQKKQLGLKSIYQATQQQRASLEAEKTRKASALLTLSQEVKNKKTALQRMLRDEKNLTFLVKRLNQVLQEEARKHARAQATYEKAELARMRSLKSTDKLTQDKQNFAKEQRSDYSQTTELEKASRLTVTRQHQPILNVGGPDFRVLKGHLRLPVIGLVTGRFGEAREEGSTWKGVFIHAKTGQIVKAVAEGKVVFADWLRGFGNMIIIDHSHGYMSLYGQNESLLKRVGDRVKGGEGIATVGNSGANKEEGLYFEIRHHGQPQNPLKWAPAV